MTQTSSAAGVSRPAWNRGKITGPKPPLRPSHVWAIRAKLDLEKSTRDLAMFNLSIDSKSRGCDFVTLRVGDVPPNGYAKVRANVRQRKTGRPVRFELTEPTRDAVDSYLRMTNRKAGEYLFPGGRNPDGPLSTRQYARLIIQVGRRDRSRQEQIRYTFPASSQGDIDLSPDRQPARGATLAAIRRLKAPCGMLASRSTMPLRSPRKLRSELRGQSGPALPRTRGGPFVPIREAY
jgi:hypothetical protein